MEVEKDYQKAYEWYIKSANQGIGEAQFNVGNMYLCDLGREQDYQEE